MMKWKKAMAVILGVVTVAASGVTAFAAPKTMTDGTVFDAVFYAKTYPDVVAVLGTDEAALYKHYVTYGKKEGRLAVAPATDVKAGGSNTETRPAGVPATAVKMSDGTWFDPVFYAQAYPDVVKALGKTTDALYKHYKTYGKKEGRLPYAIAAEAQTKVVNSASTEVSKAAAQVADEYNKAYNDTLNEYNKAVNQVASSLPSSIANEYKKVANEVANEYTNIYQQTMNEYQNTLNSILGSYGF